MKTTRIVMIMIMMSMLLTATACQKEDTAAENGAKETYTVIRTDGAPDWSSVPVLQIDNVLWTEDFGIRGEGQLSYSDDALYVHLRAFEKEIRAEYTEPLSPVCQDSCLEFFYQIPGSENYFNFEINPNGCLNAQFGPEKTDRIDIVREDAGEYFDIRTDRTSDGWEVYYRIPLKFIQLFYPEYRFRGELAANFYKCGDKTVHKHYLSWAPIDLPSPNFHCPEYFGTLTFE